LFLFVLMSVTGLIAKKKKTCLKLSYLLSK
jgi:hypothetical protein